MGLYDCIIPIVLIYLQISRLALGLSPIVVLDPTIESHRNHYQQPSVLNKDQHPSGSRNRIVSSVNELPIQIRRISDNIDIGHNDYVDDYEALKLRPTVETEQNNSNQPKNKSHNKVSHRAPLVVEPTTPQKEQYHPETNRLQKKFYLKQYKPTVTSRPLLEEVQEERNIYPHYHRTHREDSNPRFEPHYLKQQNDDPANSTDNPDVSRLNPVRRGRINIKPWKNHDTINSREVKSDNDRAPSQLSQKVNDSNDDQSQKKILKTRRVPRRKSRINDQLVNEQQNQPDQLHQAQSSNYDRREESPTIYDNIRRRDDGPNDKSQLEVVAGSETHETHHSEPEKHSESHEMGGGGENHEGHHEHEGHHDDEDYESHHEHENGEKGHHDKESHDKHYDEEEGKENKHSDDSSYHEQYESGEKKEKEAEFAEEGKFSKGHSTKGNHVVHKKDEYEKLVEFYDESHEEDGHEKDDEYHHEYEKADGGHHKSGHHKDGGEIAQHGSKSEHKKGHHYQKKEGHDKRQGDDKHHHEESKYGKKGDHEEGEKWEHSKKE